jgi:FKBP-type peptidyl-prolyl cis-trans isomerase FklB
MSTMKLPIVLGVLAAATTPVWFWPEHRPVDAPPPAAAQVFGKQVQAEQIASLRVAAFDDAAAGAKILEVKRADGLWTIPSHFGYPADGNTRVTKAAESLLALAKGRPVTGDAAQHETLGVLDPLDAANLGKKGGHGKRVTLTDAAGAVAVDLLVGKSVEGASGLCYVRELGSNDVFTAKLDAWDLSTKFIDYVEPDPFKFKREDVRALSIADYSVDEGKGQVNTRSTTTIARLGGDKDWACDKAPEGKKVNKTTVDALLSELTYVRLAGVRPFERQWLTQRGFYVTEQGLYGNEGSLSVTTKDGLRYWLFFGEMALDDDEDKAADRPKPAAPASAAEAKDAGKTGKNRYLAVFVQYDDKADEDKPAPGATAAETKDKKKIGGKERAAKTQARFQKFFYVITDETFKKLRPAIDTLFEAKPAEPMAGTTGKTNVQWLDENGKREGVKSTASGLQYEVLASGPADGKTPTDADSVEVKYKGSLVDGTEFDATKGDATATFGVTGVIKGWTEALKLMRPGDKWKLFIPSALGYGEAGSPPKIGANQILVFEVEMVKVLSK